MKKLSVIIPVYNVEAYLDECMKSIMRQMVDGCELILVDDGSTDSSGAMCDRYRTENEEIVKVIHKENGGLSSARNAGLTIAEGTYIAFVDSDDRLADGALPAIAGWIDETSADLCFMRAVKFFVNGQKEPLGDGITRSGIRGKNTAEVVRYLSTRPKYPGSACTKLYRRDFLTGSGIEFPKDKRTNEDLGFVFDCLINAGSFDALDIPYYEYRQGRKTSITQSSGVLRVFWNHALFVTESREKLHGMDPERREVYLPLMTFAAYEYSLMINMYGRLAEEDKEKAYRFLKENVSVMKYSGSRKTLAIRICIRVLGLKNTARLLNIYMTRRNQKRSA